MSTTTALVVTAEREIELRDIEIPEVQPGEVRIKTLYSLLSLGTEASIATGARPENAKFPYVPGYQGVGRIEACASDVAEFQEGDVVLFQGGRVMPPHHAVWGSHQGDIVCSVYGLFKCPPTLHPRLACVATIFAVGMHGVDVARVGPTDTVLVLGHGLIGAGAAQAARARGAFVIVSEPDHARRKLALENGADLVIDPREKIVADEIRPYLVPQADGVDVVIESTGVSRLIDEAARLTRTQGRLVHQGWYSGDVSYHFMTPHAKEITAYYPTGWGGPFWEGERGLRQSQMKAAAVRLANHQVFQVEPYISHSLSREDAVEGYKLALSDRRQEIIGMTFDWQT